MPLFQRTTNRLLHDIESDGTIPSRLPPEEQLARRYGVSRATIRKALGHLNTCGVLRISGHAKTVVRSPRKADYFPLDEKAPQPRERVLDCLVERLCKAKDQNKTHLTETELARELGCNRQIIREELARISYYGLVVKHPNHGWEVTEFSEDLLNKIFEIREMFELHAVNVLLGVPANAPIWRELEYLYEQLKNLSRDDAYSQRQAIKLDLRLHDTILRACDNPYMTRFHNMCHFLIQYNLRRKDRLQERLLKAREEHLVILDALLRRDEQKALSALRSHFDRARVQIAMDAEEGESDKTNDSQH